MITDNLFNVLSTYYKTENLYSNFDTNVSKLTANNYNHVVSAIYQIASTGINISAYLKQYIDSREIDITDKRIAGDAQLKELIDQISARQGGTIQYANKALSATSAYYAVDSISADYSINALNADYATEANHTTNSISFITNNNSIISFNGSTPITINGILNAYSAEIATAAQASNTALSSTDAQHATSADVSLESLKTRNKLYWFSSDESQVLQFDGSSDAIVSSVLFSVSSKLCNQAQYAISADYDGVSGYPLNTRVQYIFSQDQNYDFPILFSVEEASKIESNNNYNVKYHEQINVNPYLGAIKANYFIGTAVSATYAVCDQYSNLLNTRVCQNSTNNNYNYPIALSFIDSHGNPTDGVNHQLLYTYNMRINPYNNIIFPKQTPPQTLSEDIDYAIYKGTNNQTLTFHVANSDYQHNYKTHQDYAINFVGLATRAICDVSGYPINQKPITHNYTNVNSNWNPLIIGSKSGFNINNPTASLAASCHDQLLYSNKIIVKPDVGSMNLSGILTVTNNIVCNNNCTISKALTVGNNTQINGNLTVGSSNAPTDTTLWSTISVGGESTFWSKSTFKQSVDIIKNLAVTGTSSLNGMLTVNNAAVIKKTLNVTENVTSPKFIGVATSAQWADLAEIYQTDMQYPIGTLIQFGGQKQITIATSEVNGVISDKPGYLMNSNSKGQPIALIGRVYIRIKGPIKKFDYVILSDQSGVGVSNHRNKTNAIARALEDKLSENENLVQCVVKLEL